MLMIRLQRVGKTKQASYRMIISEKLHDTQYGAVEVVGLYQPLLKKDQLTLKADRIKHWLSVGAQMSPTVHNLLLGAGLVSGKKQKSVFLSEKRKKALADKKAKPAA